MQAGSDAHEAGVCTLAAAAAALAAFSSSFCFCFSNFLSAFFERGCQARSIRNSTSARGVASWGVETVDSLTPRPAQAPLYRGSRRRAAAPHQTRGLCVALWCASSIASIALPPAERRVALAPSLSRPRSTSCAAPGLAAGGRHVRAKPYLPVLVQNNVLLLLRGRWRVGVSHCTRAEEEEK